MSALQNPEAGFTLVEVLIALTLFTIGLLCIAGMQVTAIKINSAANRLTANAAIASGILEEILAWPESASILKNNGSFAWDFDLLTPGKQNTLSLTGGGTCEATFRVDNNFNAGPGTLSNLTRIEVTVEQVGNTRGSISLVGFKRGG